MTRIYFVRHGETEWNVLKKMQGSCDIPLNDNGMAEARRVKTDLEKIKIDMIICSPLRRTRQTAEIINEDKKADIVFDENLRERDYGEFEGINKM